MKERLRILLIYSTSSGPPEVVWFWDRPAEFLLIGIQTKILSCYFHGPKSQIWPLFFSYLWAYLDLEGVSLKKFLDMVPPFLYIIHEHNCTALSF